MQNANESDYPIFQVTSNGPKASATMFNRGVINSSMHATQFNKKA